MSAVKDVSRESKKLHEVAHALRLPNASRINWTQYIQMFGAAIVETIELVESLCAMHFNINLKFVVICLARMVHLSMEVVCAFPDFLNLMVRD